VDGLVFVTGDKQKLRAGDIVPVEIVTSHEYDLVGVAAGRPHTRNARNNELASIGNV
jgi:hypothetical protein